MRDEVLRTCAIDSLGVPVAYSTDNPSRSAPLGSTIPSTSISHAGYGLPILVDSDAARDPTPSDQVMSDAG